MKTTQPGSSKPQTPTCPVTPPKKWNLIWGSHFRGHHPKGGLKGPGLSPTAHRTLQRTRLYNHLPKQTKVFFALLNGEYLRTDSSNKPLFVSTRNPKGTHHQTKRDSGKCPNVDPNFQGGSHFGLPFCSNLKQGTLQKADARHGL